MSRVCLRAVLCYKLEPVDVVGGEHQQGREIDRYKPPGQILQFQSNYIMRVVILFLLTCVIHNISFSQKKIPSVLKRNWISASDSYQMVKCSDTLLLIPDNEQMDTGRFLYSYWRYHGKNKFARIYFDKTQNGIVDPSLGIYEKWKFFRNDSQFFLRIKQMKTKKQTKYRLVFINYTSHNVEGIYLIPVEK